MTKKNISMVRLDAIKPNTNSTSLARSGINIDTLSAIWRLAHGCSINWAHYKGIPAHLLHATKEYMKYRVNYSAPEYVQNQFQALVRMVALMATQLEHMRINEILDYKFFNTYQQHLRNKYSDGSVCNYLDAYRRWYIWCSDAGFTGFDVDVSIQLNELVIGGNEKGSKVLSHDPDEGPLHDAEFEALLGRLRIVGIDRVLSLFDLVAAWLMVAFGTNPKNLVWLNEEDYKVKKLSDGQVLYMLRIPRIKKSTAREREQMKPRILTPEIGVLVEQLINENRNRRAADPRWDVTRYAASLFARTSPSILLQDTGFDEDAYRVSTSVFGYALRNVVSQFNLKSMTGGKLRISPRRLRYTFATRLVQEGASPLELAEALDHTDTQQVMVYFNARLDIVRDLDRALALKLARHAQAFLGMVIGSESQAIRGDDLASRIPLIDAQGNHSKPGGSCGNFGFCGLYAPIACYTCIKFQAWAEAPHGDMLQHLLTERERKKKAGADPKMVQIHDQTILAIAEVIRRCEEWFTKKRRK